MASAPRPSPAAPERAFRDALGQFASGVVIAAADDGYRAHGLTVASFCSVSLSPQLCLLCVSATSPFISIVRGVGAFSTHVLAASQKELAQIFAYRPAEERVALLERRVDAPPVVPKALVGFDFRLHADHPGGDHRILVGELTDLRASTDGESALGWARGQLGPLSIG
ncbi:MAG: flavin reductase family protein [Neomegalonema sp.]|nr:flavin reductase family protein [Neomegalonema sp.]